LVSCTTSRSCSANPRQTTQALESARYLDEHFIQQGLLGVASGQGFYSYPDPAFEEPGFIEPVAATTP
jgi:3-hydroxyacyl-CoA dehydrogenase